MSAKSSSLVYNPQKNFSTVPPTVQLAREIIKKRPGIFIGNLKFWIRDKIPKSTWIDIELAFIELREGGYFFTFDECVYPPNKVDKNLKLLNKFISINNMSFTEYGIIYELYKITKAFSRISEFSRRVVSHGWSENEREVKISIQKLFLKDIITEQDGSIVVNWKLIQEAIQ